MRLRLTQALEVFDLLSQLDESCRLKLSLLGWETTISMGFEAIRISIPPAAAKGFSYIGTTRMIGLDLKKILSRLEFYDRWYDDPEDKEPDVTFNFKWDDARTYKGTKEPICYLELRIVDTGIVETIQMPYYDSLRSEQKIPRLETLATITIKTNQLRQALAAAKGIEHTEDIILTARNNFAKVPEDKAFEYCRLTLEAGNKEHTLLYPFNLYHPVTQVKREELKSTYTLANLKNLIDAIFGRRCEKLMLQFSTDYPLHISFRICDGKVPCDYYLSPKVKGEK